MYRCVSEIIIFAECKVLTCFYCLPDHKKIYPFLETLSKAASKRNDLYQGSTQSYIHWPYSLQTKSSCFRLDSQRTCTTNILTTLSLSAQYSNGTRHIILKVESDMMTMFGLFSQMTSLING